MKINDPKKLKDFLINRVLYNPAREQDAEVVKQLSYVSGERITRPLIYVGMAHCGQVAGAAQTLREIARYLEETHFEADLIEGGCIGFCAAEPLVDIQLPGKARLSFRNITHDKVHALLDEVFNNHLPEEHMLGQHRNPILQTWEDTPFLDNLPFFKLQKKLITANCGIIDPVSAAQYIAKGGYWAFADTIARKTPEQACDILENSQLAGRGGGGYLAGKKWKISLHTASDQKYFICNAVESDPGSYMNRMVMESNPHLLIESMLLAAYAIGASKAFIFTRSEFGLAIQRLRKALERAREYGIVGHNIFNSGVNIDIVIKEGARAFVCGEETALINSIEGKRAMPTSKPPFPATRGLWNKPTTVNNVETLINVPMIFRHGPEWFRQFGSQESKGTKIFSLSGKVKNFGTIEVEMGMPFRTIVDEIGGGISSEMGFKAIILGINSGSYITAQTLDTPVDFNALKAIGSALGSGACVVVDQSSCMVDLAMFFTRFFKNESCGKCIPCREGTARMLEIIEGATQKPAGHNSFQTLERFKGVMQLKSLAAVMKDTSLCALGRSAPNAVLNTLANFKQEFDAHVFERKCPAGVCRDLRTFTIDVDKCTGCTACFKKCPVDAIIGTALSPHFIVQDKCIGCGNCYEVCKFNAVLIE